ncbi:hypothetical protein QLX67_13510, partial [Balneolaceae bacterium ANBcel3]|nr:hypothetical protein [Balneolaceae bacterium ANBcel3]
FSMFIFFFCFTDLHAQTECLITDYYGDFLNVEIVNHNEQEFIHKSVIQVETESCVKDLVNNNTMYFDYLLAHFITRENYSDLVSMEDPVEIQSEFQNHLKNEHHFNSIMTELADKTINNKLEKDSVRIDYVLNVALKYFAITNILEDGQFMLRVCIGANLIRATEPEINPHIEAFTYSAVMKNFLDGSYNLREDLGSSLRNLYTLNLGTEPNDILLRAQGALFMAMRENSRLKELLIDEYSANKEFLPFKMLY